MHQKHMVLMGSLQYFFKEAKHILSEPLARLYNLSLRNEKFPDMLKKANVLPLYKKDEPDNCGNYRPVSLLNVKEILRV